MTPQSICIIILSQKLEFFLLTYIHLKSALISFLINIVYKVIWLIFVRKPLCYYFGCNDFSFGSRVDYHDCCFYCEEECIEEEERYICFIFRFWRTLCDLLLILSSCSVDQPYEMEVTGLNFPLPLQPYSLIQKEKDYVLIIELIYSLIFWHLFQGESN